MPASNLPDGFYYEDQLHSVIDKNAFSSEKELCSFIEQNIFEFTNELGLKYKSHKREYALAGYRRWVKGSRRLDFVINTMDGKRIAIECKRPSMRCELAAGIGQLLSYITIFERMERPIDRFILVSSLFDPAVPEIISRFNLPIEYIVMDKTKALTWVGLRKN